MAAPRFTPQSTPSLASPVTWLDVTNPPAVVGGQFTVPNTASGGANFFPAEQAVATKHKTDKPPEPFLKAPEFL